MTHRVLVVEDDPLWRHVLQRRLATAGYEVESAENGHAALQLLAGSATLPDVILTDLWMPEAGGLELCAGVRGAPHLAHLPIIVMSAVDSQEYREPLQSLGVFRFLTKPVAADEVLAAVLAALTAGPNAAMRAST